MTQKVPKLFVLREKKTGRWIQICGPGVSLLIHKLHHATFFHSMKEAKEKFERSREYIRKHYELEEIFITTNRMIKAREHNQVTETAMFFGKAKEL